MKLIAQKAAPRRAESLIPLVLAAIVASGAAANADTKTPEQKTPEQKASDVLYSRASANGVFVFDYGVPSSPALNLIGLTPDKTTVQTALKPFVLSLPQLVSGGADQSAALDLAPLWLFGANGAVGYDQYVGVGAYAGKSDYWLRFKYRFRTDLALFTGDDGGGVASKAKPSQIALGFSLPLLDDSDPLTAVDPAMPDAGPAWISCIHDAETKGSIKVYFEVPADLQKKYGAANRLLGVFSTLGPNEKLTDQQLKDFENDSGETPNGSRAQGDIDNAKAIVAAVDKPGDKEATANTAAQKAIAACTAKANNFARFAPSLNIGAGVDAQGTPGTLGGFKNANAVFWLSGKYPLGLHLGSGKAPDVSDSGAATADGTAGDGELDYWMIGGSARASLGTFVATGNTATPQIRADTFNGWLGLERNSSWLILSAQAGYQTVRATDPAQATFSKSGWRWLASSSLKLSSEQNGIWLDLSYGSAHGTIQTLDDKTVMLSLNFGPANPANLFGENTQH